MDPKDMSGEEARVRFDLACLDYVKSPNTEAFDFILKYGSSITVLEFVKVLRPNVTDNDEATRLNAITLLIDFSLKLSLKPVEVKLFLEFLAGRLSDRYTIIPKILSGITSFAKAYELDTDTIKKVCEEFFEHVDVPALHQETRYKAYNLLYTILQRNILDMINTMKQDFVLNYIRTIDGEQDPRNLIIVFKMNVIVLQHFNLDGIEETIFDVISCYYPIDFQPPEDEEKKVPVTPDQLKAHLNNCLKANGKLASHVIPLLLDKFDSSLLDSRLQSMETLKQCILAYGIGAMEEFGTRVWNEVKNEIYNGVNSDLREKCLDVVSAIFWVITLPNVKSKELDPVSFLVTSRDFAEEKLSYCEEKYFKPTILIYVAIIRSSGVSSGLVSKYCLPSLWSRYQTHTDTSFKVDMLNEMSVLYEAFLSEPTRIKNAVEHVDWIQLQSTLMLELESCKCDETNDAVLCILSEILALYQAAELHKEKEQLLDIAKIVQGVYNNICTQENIAEGSNALSILTVISRTYPDTVNSLLLLKLLNKIDEGDKTSQIIISRLLVGDLFIQHSQRLMKRLSEHEDIDIIHLLTTALSYQETEDVFEFCMKIIFQQMLLLLLTAATSESSSRLSEESAMILFQGFTTALYTGYHSHTEDMKMFMRVFDRTPIMGEDSDEYTPSQAVKFTRFAAIIEIVLKYAALDYSIELSWEQWHHVLKFTSDPLTVRSVCSIIGIVISRGQLETTNIPDLEGTIDKIFMLLEDSSSDISYFNKAWLMIRLGQALIQGWHHKAEKAIQLYVMYLTNKTTHAITVTLTKHLLLPIHRGHRIVLYKQRFLMTLIPLITPYINANNSDLSSEVKSSLVEGVCVLLESLPQTVVGRYGDTLYPIVLSALSTPSATSLVAALKLSQYLITHVPSCVILHLDTLIRSLCHTATSASADPHGRVHALEVLATCTRQLHHTHTHVHREYVLRRVKQACGDRKRVVRTKACEVLEQWLKINL